MFRESMWLATAVWVLSRLVGLTDVWLHSTSFSFRWPLSVPTSTESHMWGVSFNQSICADMMSIYNNSHTISPQDFECLGPYQYFVAYESWGNDIGFNVMTNSSEARFQIGIVDEDTTVVLPAPKYVDLNNTFFTIPTFGARASCTSISHFAKKKTASQRTAPQLDTPDCLNPARAKAEGTERVR